MSTRFDIGNENNLIDNKKLIIKSDSELLSPQNNDKRVYRRIHIDEKGILLINQSY